MTYQQSLIQVLSDVFHQVVPESDGFLLQGHDVSVRVVATESAVESRARTLAEDGVLALGAVQDDPTGVMAGIGLLAIHIEELVGSNPAVTRIEVTPEGLRANAGS